MNWLAIAAGAVLGAWARWLLSLWLNAAHIHLPIGTLLANLGGAYLIGICFGFFQSNPAFPPEWRLFAVTGFLGALTTFSTFSAESMVLLQRGEYLWALWHAGAHLFGSVACCIAGYASYRAVAG